MTTFICTDNYTWLQQQPDNSIDSIVTDSPYGLGKEPDPLLVLRDWLDHGYHELTGAGFMGKKWDAFVPQPLLWRECLRVLKPGGHLLSFFGTRTYDWGVMAIRIAGFQIRDQIAWVYGSGFPKSHDVSKAIDKAAGAEREVIGQSDRPGKSHGTYSAMKGKNLITSASTDLAKQWSGWGTALKPAMEPIVVARKPLVGTVPANLEQFGTGAINIDACRVPFIDDSDRASATFGSQTDIKNQGFGSKRPSDGHVYAKDVEANPLGRWPANLIHDGSDEVLECFPNTGISSGGGGNKTPGKHGIYGKFKGHDYSGTLGFGDSGSASRFFYCAKASREERNRGLENFKKRPLTWSSGTQNPGSFQNEGQNFHPTVKPIALMRYLIRLVTPRSGIVLDPFSGSGTTGIAAELESINCICLENDPDSHATAIARAAAWRTPLFG